MLIALLALAGVGVGYSIIRSNYYVSAYRDNVAIMRGVPGSILGVPLQRPFLLGCLNDRNELSQISPGQASSELDCTLMRLGDLRPSERAQVTAGLPTGSLEAAIDQLRELARTSLLPVCAPPPATRNAGATPAPRSPGAATKPPAKPAAPPQKPGTDCRGVA